MDRCFASDADLQAVIASTTQAQDAIQGTPSFALNGKPIGTATWASLEPQLRAAGAR